MVLSFPENSWNEPHSVNTQGAGRECSVSLFPNPHSCQSPKCYSGDTVPSQILYHMYRVKGEFPKQYWWVPFIFFASHNLSYSYIHKKHKYSLRYKNLVISVCNKNVYSVYDMEMYCLWWHYFWYYMTKYEHACTHTYIHSRIFRMILWKRNSAYLYVPNWIWPLGRWIKGFHASQFSFNIT